MNSIEIKRLEIEDLCSIQEYFNKNKIQLRWSVFALYEWESYGFEIYFAIYKNEYIFFSRNIALDTAYQIIVVLEKIFVTSSYLEKAIEYSSIIQEFYIIFSENLEDEIINKLNLKVYDKASIWTGNYLYLTETLKGFPGKKMQKKRNHYNGFIKSFDNYKIEILDKQNLEEARKFVNFLASENLNENKSYEHIFQKYKEGCPFLKGSILYLGDQVIGVTIGILNNNVFEILIEKAMKEYRGSFQFLLSENLRINNINTKYIDRQDDMGNENLRKSKESYYPLKKTNIISYIHVDCCNEYLKKYE